MPAAHRSSLESRWAAVCLLASAFAATAPAQAQAINKCRIDGQLVLQSSPCPLEARPGVRVAALVVAPQASGVRHKPTLAELLHARDGNDPPPAHAIQSDGANVLRSRMGAV